MFFVVYGIAAAAVLLNVYLIFSYVRCGFGKYPPVIGSFGAARREVLSQAEKLLAGRPQQQVVDLGCGYGSLLLPLAAKFPQHVFVGLEWDWVAYLVMRFRSRNKKNLHVLYGNFMTRDWSRFDLILCFIGNEIAGAAADKICRECRDTARIISEAFALPGLYAEKEIAARTYGMPLKVFVYCPRRIRDSKSSKSRFLSRPPA